MDLDYKLINHTSTSLVLKKPSASIYYTRNYQR